MKEKPAQLHNLPNLFKSIFDLYIPRSISHGATSLLFALIYKFNQVPDKKTGQYFPETLHIYNFELAKMLGITEKTVIKLRLKLVNFRLVEGNDDTWLINYVSGGTRECGFYQINIHLLENINPSNMSVYWCQLERQTENNEIPKSHDIGVNIEHGIPEKSKKTEFRAPEFPKNEKSGKKLQPFSTQLNTTKQNISSSVDPSLISTVENLENENNDDDIVAIAEEIADKKIELTEQIVSIQKKLIARYSLQEWDKKPSYQFIKDLLKINEAYGGFEYVMEKIDQMPIPLEISEIGKVLRAWCQRPGKRNNVNIQKPQKSDFQIDMENRIEDCRKNIESCKSVEDGFWELLSERMSLEKESTFREIRGTARDLWDGYKLERIRLDPDKTLEWFMETFMNEKDPDSWGW